jgi:hypothetical protein
MIRVRVTRTGNASRLGASGVLLLTARLAASPTTEPLEDVEVDESAFTVMNPGTGVFELAWAHAAPTGYTFVGKGSIDEFVRARQRMSFVVPAHYLWERLHPTEAFPNDPDRLKKLSAKLKVLYVRDGAVIGATTVKTKGWEGVDSWALTATTGSFSVHRRAHAVRFEMTVNDAGAPGKTVTVGASDFLEVPVIGGDVPSKTALFDSDGPALRTRILEGGAPVRGADLTLGYTDWRAATLVDASRIDRQIGTATSFSRFGAIELPIHGELQHEVSYDVAFDGAWQGETLLAGNAASRLVSGLGRVAFEGQLFVPKTATSIEVFFHVKTFLKVDYGRFSNVTWRKYQDGQRLLVAEKWDNENGVPYDNYDFAPEKR